MAQIPGFDPSESTQNDDFSPIPTGSYLAVITDSEIKPTKKGDGQYLEFTYSITDGPFKGRKIWSRQNFDNPSMKSVGIANSEIIKISRAVGIDPPRFGYKWDSQNTHYKPHVIRVEFIPAGTTQKNGYTTTLDGNNVKDWEKAEVAAAAPAPPWANRAA